MLASIPITAGVIHLRQEHSAQELKNVSATLLPVIVLHQSDDDTKHHLY